ncbi:SpoVK/Ycf46/Vps4 family AAA+-type ATPase [Haloferula luteola]|uniref:SpoVK/Ycf46/Vps4 family AAA+-type ATPase n=1 Tax=Haloferula luteola TaxID=595692 RepID=A0A840VIZ4_9BACT|nr:ATP-binding protein [Haloferula luteola]MBB5353830.1 SpoVK/Ycf46/Vps4 family AAA+-type ATPase [Haloferula luteola]
MATATQIKALLASHSSGDNERFRAVALQVAAAEARKGHQKLADELRDLVNESRRRAASESAVEKVHSLSAPQGEASELLEHAQTHLKLEDLVLECSLRDRVDRILAEQKNLGRLKENNLRPRQRLLFTGPPGCGKTITAAALANELRMPLFVVRLDSLISRYLGESLSKLRLIFDAAERHRAVYLFDEFDSIGFTRDAAGDVGEMRRVLNAFLVFIEKLTSNSLIIAATNYGQRLDRALFRRFDDLIEFGLPEPDQARETVRRLLRDVDKERLSWAQIDPAAKGLSYAEITRASEEAIKEMLILDLPKVTNKALVGALTERRLHLNH